VLIVVAGAIFLAQPWWSRRRKHLTELAGADSADLVRRLEGVRQRAGTGPVVWLLQPLNARLSAFAFGRPGRRFVAVSGGAAVAAVREPAAFEAVILHELAHIKNRDIDQTYLALAIWRAFVVVALLPLAVVLIVSRVLGEPQLLIWRMAVLALIVYSLRNAILRSREFDADARAWQIDSGIALDTVLADLPARTGRQAWHLGWKHPSGRDRVAALADPAPLFRFRFWDGLGIGLVAALGAAATHEIVTLLSTTVGVHWVVPAIIFAAFAGPALTVAMWRRQLREPDTGLVKGWAAGLGLGLGLAVGPVIVPLAAYSQALAPDHPSLASVGVLAVWIVLVVLIFTPFPVWVGALGRRLAAARRYDRAACSRPGRHGSRSGRRVGRHGRRPVPAAGEFHRHPRSIQCARRMAWASGIAAGHGHCHRPGDERLAGVPAGRGHARGSGGGVPSMAAAG
jgi:Zn-dependent protease with chaperone function